MDGGFVVQALVVLLQIVDVHLQTLVDAPPRVVRLTQGRRLFVQVLRAQTKQSAHTPQQKTQ